MPYYALANGYKGQELKLALRSIISIQTKTEKYDDLRTDLAKTDKGSTEGTIIPLSGSRKIRSVLDNSRKAC